MPPLLRLGHAPPRPGPRGKNILFFFVLTALLRCNSYTKLFTPLKSKIQWFLVYSQMCPHPTVYLKRFHHLDKKPHIRELKPQTLLPLPLPPLVPLSLSFALTCTVQVEGNPDPGRNALLRANLTIFSTQREEVTEKSSFIRDPRNWSDEETKKQLPLRSAELPAKQEDPALGRGGGERSRGLITPAPHSPPLQTASSPQSKAFCTSYTQLQQDFLALSLEAPYPLHDTKCCEKETS